MKFEKLISLKTMLRKTAVVNLMAVATIVTGTIAAHAETYRTFVSPLGQALVSITFLHGSGQPEIDAGGVRVNGAYVKVREAKYDVNTKAISIVSEAGRVVLSIPGDGSVKKTEWIHQAAQRFSDGDARVLSGESLIINGLKLGHLVEIYASE